MSASAHVSSQDPVPTPPPGSPGRPAATRVAAQSPDRGPSAPVLPASAANVPSAPTLPTPASGGAPASSRPDSNADRATPAAVPGLAAVPHAAGPKRRRPAP